MAKYRVLLVTGGRTHQENYAASFRADARAEVVAVADERGLSPYRQKHNRALADQLRVPYIEGLEEAFRRTEPDVVSICAEPQRRARVIARCMELGAKALYLDKSLCAELERAIQLAEEADRRHVFTHMYTNNTQPWARAAAEQVRGGVLGQIRAVHADAFFAKGKPGTAQLSRRRELYPPTPGSFQTLIAKRELDNIGVYPLMMITWLTGQRVREVLAVTANYFFREHQQENVEDFAGVLGTLSSGAVFSISCGRIGWTSHPAAGTNRITLVGDRASATYDMNRCRLYQADDGPPWQPPEPHPEDPMFFWASTQEAAGVRPKRVWLPLNGDPDADVRYFLDCLDRNQPSEMDIHRAAHATEVIFACYRAAATGRPQRVT